MRRTLQRAATYLGLLRRPGEPDPVFTPTEQGRTAAVLTLGVVLVLSGLVAQATGRSVPGILVISLGVVVVTVLNVDLLRVRRRRAAGRSAPPGG